MSEYVVCETMLRDKDVLIDALMDMGISNGHIEVHDVAKSLVGYKGDSRSQKAHVIIRRKHVGGASNDIGFEKCEDGSYKAWVSDYDKNVGIGKRIMEGELARCYSKKIILNTASKTRGHKVKTIEEKDGRIRIRVSVR
jgi:hypothetical protein